MKVAGNKPLPMATRIGFVLVPLVALAGCAGLRPPQTAPAPVPAATTASPSAPADAAPAPKPVVPPSPPAAVTPAPAPVTTPTPTPAPSPPPATAARPPRGGIDTETLARYRAWIDEARVKHPYTDSAERMFDVMMCESRGNATIVNPAGPNVGLFQYNPRTWSGAWNDYKDQSINDPKAQIFATAQAWQKRMQGHWGCWSRLH